MRRLLIALGWLVPALSIAAWIGYGHIRASPNDQHSLSGEKSPASHVPVVVAEVKRSDLPIYLTGIGTVQAFNSALVRSRVDGQIVKIDFAEGQIVHPGDILAEVDPRPYEAARDLAVATKLRDQAQLDNARLDFERASRLVATGSGTTQGRDTAKATAAQFAAIVQADQAAIDAAQIQLSYTKIQAPLGGRTGTRQIDVGNIVRATDLTGIVTINQMQPISVAFDLPSRTLPLIRTAMQGGDALADVQDADGKTLATGELAVIDNQINVATATIRCKATFANSDEALWPGQFVDVRLLLSTQHGAVTVPITAVLHGPDSDYTFVVGADHAIEKRALRVGFTNQEVAAIINGLQPGELVVTDGQYRIEAGMIVDLLPQTPQTVPPPPVTTDGK